MWSTPTSTSVPTTPLGYRFIADELPGRGIIAGENGLPDVLSRPHLVERR
jgi:hypothetical protein